MYLIQGVDGTMVTIIAQSIRGAVKKYCSEYGDKIEAALSTLTDEKRKRPQISVKKRGEGDWQHFDYVIR